MEKYIKPKLEELFKVEIISGMKQAQEELNNEKGVYYLQARKIMEPGFKKLGAKGIPAHLSDFAYMNMILKDEMLFTKDFTQFSLIPLEGYFKWSEVLQTKFPGCEFNITEGKLVDNTNPRLNFEMLQKIFRLDLASAENNEEVQLFEKLLAENGPLMLDEATDVPQIFFASVMRSGNTLSRRLMETITGVLTGSNYSIIPCVNFALTVQGFKAENHFGNDSWILKTHFPYILPFGQIMSASRAVLLVRNPVDIIVSQFMMSTTLSHSKSISNDFPVQFAEEWQWLVKQQAVLWNQFFQYWIELSRQRKIPVHIVRFEDLLTKQKESMESIFEFVLGVDTTEGLYIGKRINDALQANNTAGQLYKPRSGKANSNLKYYNQEQLDYVKETCREYINFLGYSKTAGQENDTGFFEYSDLSEVEQAQQSGFIEFNKENKKWYQEAKEEVDAGKHSVHKEGDGIKIAVEDEPFFRFRSVRFQCEIQE